MTDAELAAHLAEVAGKILIEVRESGMFEGKALGKAGDETANQFLCHAIRQQRPEDRQRRQQQAGRPPMPRARGHPGQKAGAARQRRAGHEERRQRHRREERLAEGRLHLKFVAALYHLQLSRNKWFLHEHPVGAESWAKPEMHTLLKHRNVGGH